jgi:hypothetical protein
MPVDYEIRTKRPGGEARCRACREANDPDAPWPDAATHTCTQPPAKPRATLEARLRRNQEVRAARELRIRRERQADIDA